MDYETGKALEADREDIIVLSRVVQLLNKLAVDGGSPDSFDVVRKQMEEEAAAKGEEEVEAPKKRTGPKSGKV